MICKDGALTGKVALVRDEFKEKQAMVNEHVFLVRCNEVVTQKYLFNFFYSEYGQSLLKSRITGSAQGGLNRANLQTIKIPLPPLDVQKQIVAECEKIDSDYISAQKNVEILKNKISKIVDNIRGENKKLGDLCESYIGLTYKPKNVTSDNKGVIVLRSSNIQAYHLDFNDTVRVNCKISTRYFVQNGDVLVCVRNGSKNLLGKSAYIDNLEEPMAFGAFMAICRSQFGKWIHCWMKSPHYYNQISELTKTMSVYQLTQKALLNLLIPIPSLKEQKYIIDQIEKLESEIDSAKKLISNTAERKKAVLDKYLL